MESGSTAVERAAAIGTDKKHIQNWDSMEPMEKAAFGAEQVAKKWKIRLRRNNYGARQRDH